MILKPVLHILYNTTLLVLVYMGLLCAPLDAEAQQLPPRPPNSGNNNPRLPPEPFIIYSNPAQGMYFGAFFQGITGGSVIVYPDGSRTSTGDIVLTNLGFTYSPAIFEIEAPQGTRIGILNGADATLSGSNGGTMTVHLGSSNLGSTFITTIAPPGHTLVRVGATLYVGNSLANPVGSYSGTFAVTFIQE